MPADVSAPIVIAQLIDRSRTSQLGDIPSTRSVLPVRTVTGRERLTPGTISLVPPDRDVEVDELHANAIHDLLVAIPSVADVDSGSEATRVPTLPRVVGRSASGR